MATPVTAASSSEPPLAHSWKGYAAAVAMVVVAVLMRWALDPLLGDAVPFATFFIAVIAATWCGGLRPGILAGVLGLVAAASLFGPPRFIVVGGAPAQLLGFGLYVAMCAAICAFGEGMWRGRRRVQVRERREREQRELLRITLASIGDGVITTDAAGLVTYLNPVAETLTGWTAGDAQGQPLTRVFVIVNEHTRHPVDNPVDKVLALGQIVGLANHTLLLARDGVERPIDDSGAPIRDGDGAIVGAVLVFRDVSDRKRAERQLAQQAAMFQAIADSTTDLIYVKDSAHDLLFTNAATLQAWGLPASSTLDDARRFIAQYPEATAAAEESDDRVLAAGVADTRELSFDGPHGLRYYQTTKTPMRDAAGHITGLVGITRDMTERRAAEARLADSEERFRLLADAMPQIVYVTEPDGRVSFVNRRWVEYSGQEDAQRADLPALAHPDDLPAMFQAWDRASASGAPFEAEFRLRRAVDGEYRWFLTRSVAVRDADGRILRWNGTSTDIHDHKLAEDAARAREARHAYLVTLADALRPLTDPGDVEGTASRLLGERLGVRGVAYLEVADDRYRLLGDYARHGPSLVGEYPISAFGEELLAAYERAETVVMHDVVEMPAMTAAVLESFAAVQIRAYVAVPLVKAGRLLAVLTAHDAAPRRWTADDTGLVQETAERTWAAVERARAESAMMASEARFRALFETMDEGFCIVDVRFDENDRAVDYRILEMNPAFERHTGLSGVLGRWAREFAPSLEEFWFETYGRVAATGEPTRFVHQAAPLDGRWFDVYAFRLGDHDQRVAILFTDITARALADEVARQRSEQSRGLAAVLPRIGATIDVRSIMGVVTAEARRLVDAAAARAIYLRDDDWSRAIDVDSLEAGLADRTGADGPPTRQDLHALVCRSNTPLRLSLDELAVHPAFAAADGGDRPSLTSWLAVPLIGRDGRNMGALQLTDKRGGAFSADDESVLLQMAQMASVAIDNARLVDDLQVADQRKDEFLSVLAHELRNPLAPLRSGLHLMRSAKDDATVARVRAIMERQVGQMVRLIDDLMDLTRISRGKLLLQKAPVLLQEVLRIAVETSRPLIDQGSHDLSLDVPDVPVTVDADETRLAQVFANLLNNAAKYTPPGGRIRLAVRPAATDVVVTVEDTGVGIPAAMLEQVFDMFTQVDRSLEKSQGGLGIGLNIARRLVEKHGGRITAHSGGEGLGSRFVVHLPLALHTVVGTAAALDGTPTRGPRRRVLIVDDNVDAADSLEMLLAGMGHETRTATDGHAAVAMAERFQPDLILMDIGMPRLNGYDACRQIRRQPWATHVVIVACTGWGQEDDRQRSKDAGFDRHLVKPPLPAVLEEIVRTLPPASL